MAATAPDPRVREARDNLSFALVIFGSFNISSIVVSVICLLLSLATTIPAFTCPNSIMFASATIPLMKPKHAFEMSKTVALGGNPSESETNKAVAGSRKSRLSEVCNKHSMSFLSSFELAMAFSAAIALVLLGGVSLSQSRR
jgi:hypothetical protein